MATSKQVENLLLTEHFTWTPISLIDDIINTVNEVAYKATESLERGLLDHADPATLGFADRAVAEKRVPDTDDDGKEVYPEARLEIEEGVHKLETLLENTIDRNFDRLEIWTLRNSLCVPQDLVPWVRLAHYENLTIPPPNPAITPESLHSLRRTLQETQKLNVALQAEKARNKALLAKLRALVSPPPEQKPNLRTSGASDTKAEGAEEESKGHTFAFLTQTAAAKELGIQSPPASISTTNGGAKSETANSHPLTTHTTFTTAQLPFLKALLANLKPYLSSTALPCAASSADASGGAEEQKEVAKERKLYIESQTRRVLEKRGIDTRDGVEGGLGLEGRRVGQDEVRGLEGLVMGVFGGDKDKIAEGDKRKRVGKEEGDTEGGGDEMDTT